MIRTLPLPRPRRRGGNAMAALGKKLRPIVKGFLRQVTPMATQKLKEIGANLITSGGTVLSQMANRKRQRGGQGTHIPIKSPTPLEPSLISPKHPVATVKRRKRRKKKVIKKVKQKKGGKKRKGRKKKKGGKKKGRKKKLDAQRQYVVIGTLALLFV